MAKKITLKDKEGTVLCPHTAIEQVQGLKVALDEKLGKTENVDSANRSKYIETLHQSNGTWYGDNYKAYIQWEDSNTAKLKVDGYFTKTDEAIDAINADKAKTLKTLSGTVQDLNNLSVDSSSVEYYGYLPGSSSNMPTHNAWQNSVMCFGLHSNGATAQMFFSKDNPLYYRSSHTGDWKQLRTIDDLVTTSHIADTAITPAKIQTSIALNGTPSMTVEPTTSSPDKTIASVGLVKDAVVGLKIDTRNLIPNSASIYTKVHATSNSFSKQILLPIGTKVGDTFVFNCDGIVNNQGSATEYSLLLFDWASQRAASNYLTLTAENRMGTFTVTRDVAAGSLYIFLYAGKNNSTAGNAVTYTNCTLVRGDKPMLLWQAAPEDVQKQIDGIEVGGRNLFSTSTLTLGGIDGKIGTENTGANRVKSSNYIPFSGESITCKSWISGVRFFVCFYNSSKTIITSTWASNNSEWIESEAKVYPVPTNTAYIRMVLGKPDNSHFTTADFPNLKMKVERGNKSTDWSPSPEDVEAAARPTVYYQSTQPPVLTAKEGDIWIVS